MRRFATSCIRVRQENRPSDTLFERAVQAGAKIIMPMTDMFFGSREGRVSDPFGNVWTIAIDASGNRTTVTDTAFKSDRSHSLAAHQRRRRYRLY
jgi:hypothetical protein